jgi:hypothetical protein
LGPAQCDSTDPDPGPVLDCASAFRSCAAWTAAAVVTTVLSVLDRPWFCVTPHAPHRADLIPVASLDEDQSILSSPLALPSLYCSSRTERRHWRERHHRASSAGAAALVRRAESSLSVPSPQAPAPHQGASLKIHVPPLPLRSTSMWTGTFSHGTTPPTLPRTSCRRGYPPRIASRPPQCTEWPLSSDRTDMNENLR